MAVAMSVSATGCGGGESKETTSPEDNKPSDEQVVEVLKEYGAIAEDATTDDYTLTIDKVKHNDEYDKATVTATLSNNTPCRVVKTVYSIVFKLDEEGVWKVPSSKIDERVTEEDISYDYIIPTNEELVKMFSESEEEVYVGGYVNISALENVTITKNELNPDTFYGSYEPEFTADYVDGIATYAITGYASVRVADDYSGWKLDYLNASDYQVTYDLKELTVDEANAIVKNYGYSIYFGDDSLRTDSENFTITEITSQTVDTDNMSDTMSAVATTVLNDKLYTMNAELTFNYSKSNAEWQLYEVSAPEYTVDFAQVADPNFLTANADDETSGTNIEFTGSSAFTTKSSSVTTEEGAGVDGSNAYLVYDRSSYYSTNGIWVALPYDYAGRTFNVTFKAKSTNSKVLPVMCQGLFYKDSDASDYTVSPYNMVAVNAGSDDWYEVSGTIYFPADAYYSYTSSTSSAGFLFATLEETDDFLIDDIKITVADETVANYEEFEAAMAVIAENGEQFVPVDNSFANAIEEYKEYNDYYGPYDAFAFMNVTDDDIPEMLVFTDSYNYLYTYDKEEKKCGRASFSDDAVMYIEKSNLLAFVTVEDDGDTSYVVYKIEGTDFTKVNTFTYYKSYDKYYVGYDAVDKDKYDSEFAAAFDISKAVTISEAAGETIDAALEAAGL